MKLPSFIITLILFAFSSQAQTDSTKNGTWTFTNYSPNIVKITYKPAGYKTNENVSDAVIAAPAPSKWKGDTLRSGIIKGTQTGGIVINRAGNRITSPGHSLFSLTEPFEKDGYHGFRFQLGKETKIFGGGERALPLNRRGYKFNFYNNPWYGYSEGADNLNYSVPFLTTSDGYALLFDNASKGYADIGKSDSSRLEVAFSSGEINAYVIFGDDYKKLLAGYHLLTGTQPLPPRWALGNLMSRFGYTSEAQAKSVLAAMKKENIPVDAIIFDLFWFGDSIKGTLGNLAWTNKTKWPDPKKMIGDFKKQQVNTILITEPFVVQSSSNYANAKKFLAVDSINKPYNIADFYFGPGGLIDIFRQDARDWFWSRHKPQMDNGVEAWWGDLGEPEKHPSNLYHNLKDAGFTKRLFKADEVHNLYGHTWTKMLFEKYAKEYPKKRLFSLNRSGFAGTQRFGIFPWSGDVSRSWSGLRAQLPVMLGMSMSGIPYVHADAGGFAGGEGDNELYVRWLQFAAFTPIFRPHGTALYDVDKNTFSFPSEAALISEPYRSFAKQAINMRYALLPYNYTLAKKQASEGAPLVAPLYYYYPSDTAALNKGDEYMWGENILVAPVIQKDAKTRTVYLPGNKWYNIYNNELKSGTITDTLSMQAIPVYVKEGSFISYWFPVNDLYHSTAGYTADGDLTVVYYPSKKYSTAMLYNDDGSTKNTAGEIINFKGVEKDGKLYIQLSCDQKKYPRGTAKKIRIAIPGDVGFPFTAFVNGKKLTDAGLIKTAYFLNSKTDNAYSAIDVTFNGQPVIIEITR